MSLWADKYRPTTLDQLTYHKGLTQQLKQMAVSENIPHMLFYGPSGAGKKTRITAILREIFGPGVEKLKVDERQFATPSRRKMVFTIVSSNFHLELNPSDLGVYDRVIVQDVIKDIAQSKQIDANAKHQFKVVIIDQADELTREAQAALRRTMEKHTSTMRLILCCNSLSKIIAPVRSRCLLIRVARPSQREVSSALQLVAQHEKFLLPPELALNIAQHTQCNLRASLLALESTAVRRTNLNDVQKPDRVDWEILISKIAKMIIEEQTPAKLLAVRGHLYELITHCIQPSLVLKNLSFELAKSMDDKMKRVVIEKAAFHEHRMRKGQKHIFHLEAFVASIMHEYKCYRTGV
ncbi:P-loop containing nucleoside triphosphate hydrolase protein [Phascolomyces articulosus]|uniref:Replication factor C subunit 5 n=1 Tax=Phascolomyces articulosus TaxID=60185 RepID=A0AAD5JM04_9FUNG|nr:P-loop containing nucleoside triphosphate hydrolase protein [Phascolomyces articulosus]